MTNKIDIKDLQKTQLYSEELGINLQKNNDSELFKWFLASFLFGAIIPESIAKKTYDSFKHYKLLTPRKITNTSWSYLVHRVMKRGGYVRYDEKTSRAVKILCKQLLDGYNGSLKKLHKQATDSKDLEQKIDNLYGIGPITVNIFLRELRAIWRKANPELLPIVKELAKKYKVKLPKNRKTMAFSRIEAGLIRLRHKQ